MHLKNGVLILLKTFWHVFIALYEKNNKFYLIRDRVGIKPLFFSYLNDNAFLVLNPMSLIFQALKNKFICNLFVFII